MKFILALLSNIRFVFYENALICNFSCFSEIPLIRSLFFTHYFVFECKILKKIYPISFRNGQCVFSLNKFNSLVFMKAEIVECIVHYYL